jgi:hypothetical protein
MWRYLAGAVSALLLAGAGLFWWQSSQAERAGSVAAAPFAATAQATGDAPAEPPAASEKTREEKRFSRYDKDKDGGVAREEYLAARRRAFAKQDRNGDGKLDFDEYAVKTIAKFATADKDRSAVLTPAEFATTRVVRKARPATRCDCGAQVAAALAARDDE